MSPTLAATSDGRSVPCRGDVGIAGRPAIPALVSRCNPYEATGVPGAWGWCDGCGVRRGPARGSPSRRSGELVGRPGQEALAGPGVDDPVGVDAGGLGALAAVVEEVQLSRCVTAGVDGEVAADVAGERDQLRGRLAPFGSGVDL